MIVTHQLKMAKKIPKEPKEEAPKEEEKAMEPEKPELPQFRNDGDDLKIKLIEESNSRSIEFRWITVKKGDTVTIPKKIALANGLTLVE